MTAIMDTPEPYLMSRAGMSAGPYKILLVDDNPADADLQGERLAEMSNTVFKVQYATSLAQARAALVEHEPAAVILDLNLPDSNGLETLTRVRGIAPNTPILAVSGRVDDELRRQVISMGAEDLFGKDECNGRHFPRSVLYVIERYRAQEQHRQVERLLDVNPDAILVVNPAGLVRYVNHGALDLFARSREDFIGELLGFSVRDGEPIEINIPRRDGVRECEMRVVRIDWQGEPAFVGSIRDLTELKRSQREAIAEKQRAQARNQELHSLVDSIGALAHTFGFGEIGGAVAPVLNAGPDDLLSEEVLAGVLKPFEAAFRGYVEANYMLEEQNHKLAQSNASVEAAYRELETFSYSVAHDLRKPLVHIEGFSALLCDHCISKLDDEAVHFLTTIRGAAKRMSDLISDLLKLSQVTRGELSRIPVDLSKMAREVAAQTCELDQARDTRVVIAATPVAMADPNFMRVVLDNLLGNAWKFTSRRNAGHIEFGSFRDGAETVYFVRDNGAGFDPAQSHRLFGVFQRLHSRSEFDGTGVGLNIVKRVIARHHGRIWCEGHTGKGATFFFTLGEVADATTAEAKPTIVTRESANINP